jgi:hypothetical protein
MILDSVGVSIEEFNNLFRQCSACARVMLTAVTKRHLCKDSISRHPLRGAALSLYTCNNPNYLAQSQPERACILTELNSQGGVSAQAFNRTFLVCSRCSFCMTHKAAAYHSCSSAFL